jgi:hypothetical protein
VLSPVPWLVVLHVPGHICDCRTKEEIGKSFAAKVRASNATFSTYKSRLDNSASSTLVQAEIFSLSCAFADRVFCTFDLFEVLLNSGKFCEDKVFAGFDSMETKICWNFLDKAN